MKGSGRVFSNSTSTFNTWLRTRHIGAEMQKELKNIMHIKTYSAHRESTPFGIRKHAEKVKKLKKSARETFNFDLFDGPARSISTGKEIDHKIILGLLSSDLQGNETFQQFVQERFVNGQKSFFSKISKLKIETGLKKTLTKPKPVQILKEDVQGFGILAEQKIPLEEAFEYPLTTVPLSISEGADNLRSGSKSNFRNYLVDTYGVSSQSYPSSAVWIYDASRVIRIVPPRSTYREYFDDLIEKMTPPPETNPISVHMILDKYLGKESVKFCTRCYRGELSSTRIFVSGFGQLMPSSVSQWHSCLNNSDTKKRLMELFADYVLSGSAHLPYDTMINKEDKMCFIDHDTKVSRFVYFCNHEEADSRMIADAVKVDDQNVLLSAHDSDIFFLGIYGCALNKNKQWWIEYKSGSTVDLQDMTRKLGKFSFTLPSFHVMTGCDTTSYFHFRGKITPWKRLLSNSNFLPLIENLGEEKVISEQDIENYIEFVKLVIYEGKPNETLVEMKVRMYLAQTKKQSSRLPPDPNSCRQDILRKHMQAFIWKRSVHPIIESLNPLDYGWARDSQEFLVPLWYTCKQIPSKRDSKQRSKMTEQEKLDPEEINQPPVKRSRFSGSDKNSSIDNTTSDSDNEKSDWERLSDFLSSDSDSEGSDW